ncbi:adenosine kinase [Nematocida major]|uniref:adenosine kinase n=1 Tax=Nematocida major TaxID=1912982 RepID=UPI0020078838|nr:adenosine kinase [Nematocida major]KAH9386783.1 adenosine kinase [Nematocida major]
MTLFKFYTLCVPFIDIFISNSEIVQKLGLNPNEMTLYSALTPAQRDLIADEISKSHGIKLYYGGMAYNTCMEIAQRQSQVQAVFIGPFSTDKMTKQVFAGALEGKVQGLTIFPEYIESEGGKCYVIPNGKNRAMITKVNLEQTVSRSMVDTFMQCVSKSENRARSILYISAYTVESSTESIMYLMKARRQSTGEYMTVLNLSDPGVISRSHDAVKVFLNECDWVVGNIAEYTELFVKERGRSPQSRAELHSHIENACQNAVITSGSEAVAVLYKEAGERKTLEMEPDQIDVINTTGAGDVFAANFFTSMLEDPEDMRGALGTAIKRTNEYLTRSAERGLK